MRRRSIFSTLLILGVTFVAVFGLLGYLLKQEPQFYAGACRDGVGDQLAASELLTRFGDVQNDIRTTKAEWGSSFTATELNAFFREHLDRTDGLAELLPVGINSPRVTIIEDRLQIATRYRNAPFEFLNGDFLSTVLSVELKTWVVSREQNTVAVEVCGLWAGALPVSSQRYLDRVSDAARKWNIEITWYRNNGNPVGLLRFYADQTRPSTFIRTVKIADDKLTIGGRSLLDAIAAPVANELQPMGTVTKE